MWARVVEIMLASFLAISSFFFQGFEFLWIFNLCVASWIWIFSLTSFYYPLRKLHLMNLLAAMTLIIFAFSRLEFPLPAIFQSYVVLSLLLFIFVIIPSHASNPPELWVKFYKKSRTSKDAL